MAAASVTFSVQVDTSGYERSVAKALEELIAAAIEPTVKRELRKQLGELNERARGDDD